MSIDCAANRDKVMVDFDLGFRYADESAPALKDVRGALRQGTCVVLCGNSGCGKSTLLRCINHLVPQFYEGDLHGFCHVSGRDVSALSLGEVGKLAASVFQDPRSQFFTLNSATEVAFGLENFGVAHHDMVQRVEAAFRRFHLEDLQNRRVFQLSSGERQLIAILSAWAMDAEILLLDEPTANLDYGAIQLLHEVLASLKKQGKTLFISEHRLHYLEGIVDEYWVMGEGRIIERLAASEMLALSDAQRANRGLRVVSLASIKLSDESARDAARGLGELRTRDAARGLGELSARGVAGGSGELGAQGVAGGSGELCARDVCFSYSRGAGEVLSGLSLRARIGDVVGLVGPNGCGKTTFGKLAAGLYRPSSGSFCYEGAVLRPKQLVAQSIFIMQEAEFQFFTNSVRNELRYGRGASPELDREIERLLKSFDLWHCRDQHPFSLSGGQMQKLVLMLARLSRKPLVVLDEPTAGLDHASLQACVRLIQEMRNDKIVLVITHDLELIAQVCTRCVGFSEGRASQEFDLTRSEGLAGIRGYLKQAARRAEDRPAAAPPRARRQLDPRTKLLLAAAAMLTGMQTSIPLMLAAFFAVLTAAWYERRYRLAAISGSVMALIFAAYAIFPGMALSFVANFFPRIVLMGAAGALVVQGDEASRSLAALRKMRVPERIIMICSVIFRFFPVLRHDVDLMAQAIKTRGFFRTAAEKARAAPHYLEIMIVPMVFRVIRIAEALAASAETRGIALAGKRDSYVAVNFKRADLFIAALLAALIVAGLFITTQQGGS